MSIPFTLLSLRWLWVRLQHALSIAVKYPTPLLISPQFWVGIILLGGAAIVLGFGPSALSDFGDEATSTTDDAL
jgi:hypothetical protein